MGHNLARRVKPRAEAYQVGAYRGKRESLILWPNDAVHAEQTPFTPEQIHAMLDCTAEDPCPKCIVAADYALSVLLRNFVGLVAEGRDNS